MCPIDRSRMFATPRYVVKGGVLVVEEGRVSFDNDSVGRLRDAPAT